MGSVFNSDLVGKIIFLGIFKSYSLGTEAFWLFDHSSKPLLLTLYNTGR